MISPPAITEAICPLTLAPAACISRKLPDDGHGGLQIQGGTEGVQPVEELADLTLVGTVGDFAQVVDKDVGNVVVAGVQVPLPMMPRQIRINCVSIAPPYSTFSTSVMISPPAITEAICPLTLAAWYPLRSLRRR